MNSQERTKELSQVEHILMPNEQIEFVAVQRRIAPGGSIIAPSIIIATNVRVIIEKRLTGGVHREFDTIPYTSIVSIKVEHGIISSSLDLMTRSQSPGGQDRYGIIEGLRMSDALALQDLIEKKIVSGTTREAREEHNDYFEVPNAGYIYCNNCGAKNPLSAKYCMVCGSKL